MRLALAMDIAEGRELDLPKQIGDFVIRVENLNWSLETACSKWALGSNDESKRALLVLAIYTDVARLSRWKY